LNISKKKKNSRVSSCRERRSPRSSRGRKGRQGHLLRRKTLTGASSLRGLGGGEGGKKCVGGRERNAAYEGRGRSGYEGGKTACLLTTDGILRGGEKGKNSAFLGRGHTKRGGLGSGKKGGPNSAKGGGRQRITQPRRGPPFCSEKGRGSSRRKKNCASDYQEEKPP